MYQRILLQASRMLRRQPGQDQRYRILSLWLAGLMNITPPAAEQPLGRSANTITADTGAVAFSSPVGWASVDALGRAGTTGGGGGEVVVARTAGELKEHAARSEPLTILVEGVLQGDSPIDVSSDKTILGMGATATLINSGLSLKRVSNVIIRNLTIRDSVDAIALRESHHVWVDHCDLSNCTDGLLDITHASDYVTVSWTRFSRHNKTMLVNSGTSQPEDAGTLRVTIHHCWFDGTMTRNPRVGYGQVHVFNCLYNGNDYGIGLHSRAKVLAERNFFDGVQDPIQQMYRDNPGSPHHGFCESVDNVFRNCPGARAAEGLSFPAADFYRYRFALDAVDEVPVLIKDGAGPGEAFGSIVPTPLPGQGAIGVDVNAELRWTPGMQAVGYRVAFGESNPPESAFESDGRTFDPGRLTPDREYFWRVDLLRPEGVVVGEIWRFRTRPAKAWFGRPENAAVVGGPEVRLQWRPGAEAEIHRVYLAKEDEALNETVEVAGAQWDATGLDGGTMYRWRVDTVTRDGVIEGEEWRFTTVKPATGGPGRMEAESMTLGGGYHIERIDDASGGRLVANNDREGWMSYSHQGADGVYDVLIRFFNSNGSSRIRLQVGGRIIAEWNSDERSSGDRYRTHTFPDVRISQGDRIRIDAKWLAGDDLARADWVETQRSERR